MGKSMAHRRGSFFTPPGPHDPFGNILAAGANIIVNQGLKLFRQEMAKLFGVAGMSVTDQLALDRLRLSVQKVELDITRTRALNERQLRLLDMRLEERQLQIERSKAAIESAQAQAAQLQVPFNTEVISGALEITADPQGLSGSPEQLDAYNKWLDSIQEGKVILIGGSRGSGKTCLGAKIVEFASATYRMTPYWLGLPSEARELLPTWIKLVDDPMKCPPGCIMFIDESGIDYCSLLFNTAQNRFMRALLMICRHRHASLVFCVQTTADVDLSVIRAADSVIFKKLSLNQVETERPSMRKKAAKADMAFQGMSKMECLESAFVFDENWEGLIKFTPPSFWSENLSHVFAFKDLGELKQQVTRGNELKHIVVEESRQLGEASLDARILELRKDHGIDAIARILNCSTWRVRKCLGGVEDVRP